MNDLVTYCESVAAASGDIFGVNRISAEERQLVTALTGELKAR